MPLSVAVTTLLCNITYLLQEAFRRRNEFQLNDSAPYYFDNIERIASPNYVPTNQVFAPRVSRQYAHPVCLGSMRTPCVSAVCVPRVA